MPQSADEGEKSADERESRPGPLFFIKFVRSTNLLNMNCLERLAHSHWAVPIAGFLIQFGQYWSTLVTVDWWSPRATMSVVWFGFLWAATVLLLRIFLCGRKAFAWRCLLGAAVVCSVAAVARGVIWVQSEPRLTLGHEEVGYLIITYAICLLLGSISLMFERERSHEKEIERLKLENLSSRYNALAGQVSPHFFFNALSNLSSLIRRGRREESLDYVSNLSQLFRYVIRCSDASLTTVGEELRFIEAYRRLMGVRFADNYSCTVNVPAGALRKCIPSLSLLPLFENVAKHNTIDSEHPMRMRIDLGTDGELVVSNPVSPKLVQPESNGIGLANLDSRYRLLMGRGIRVERGVDDGVFRVRLPLTDPNKYVR